MKKRWRMITALVLAMLLIPVQAATESGSALPEQAEEYRDMFPYEILVWIDPEEIKAWDEVDYAAYISEFPVKLGLENKQRILAIDYYLYIFSFYFVDLVSTSVSEEPVDVPVLSVWLTEEEKARVEACEGVAKVLPKSGVGSDRRNYIPFRTRKFTAEGALMRLQMSVGLRPAWEPDTAIYENIDINQDGIVDSSDALIALQSSVGLIVVAKAEYLQDNGDGVDHMAWEEMRMPRSFRMIAPDLNGDGRADEADIFLKYGEIWR